MPQAAPASITIPLTVLADNRLSDGAKLLYGLLDYHSRGDPHHYEVAELAIQMSASERTISRWLTQLRSCKYIESKRGASRHIIVREQRERDVKGGREG